MLLRLRQHMMNVWRAIRRRLSPPLKRMAKALFKNHVYVSRHAMTRGLKITGDLGFLRPPPMGPDDQFLAGLDLTNKTVYDIGAHIGVLTLFFAKKVGPTGQVSSFEPNPESFALLNRNIALNRLHNVQTFNLALGEKRGEQTLIYGQYEGGRGTLDQARQAKLLAEEAGLAIRHATVQVDSLDHCIAAGALRDPDFVKIDVEGYEYHVLIGMQETLRRYKPALLVEMHGMNRPHLIENLRKVVTLLIAEGYEIREILTGQIIREDNVEKAIKCKMLFCDWPDPRRGAYTRA